MGSLNGFGLISKFIYLRANLIFYVQKYTIALLSTVFVTLIACSVQSVTADHLKPGDGIFKDETHVNLVPDKDSKYQVYLQIEVRNAQGQLVSVSSALHGKYLLHEITDYVFDSEEVSFFGEKKIITIDNIKYEKVQHTVNSEALQLPVYSSNDFLTWWFIDITANVDGHGLVILPIFDAMAPLSLIEEDDVLVFHWTILRELN